MASISRYRGDTAPDQLALVDGDGAPIDLSGSTLRLTVNTLKNPEDNTAQLFQVVGVVQAPSSAGVVWFSPTPLQADQPIGKYWYDIELVDVLGKVKTLVKDRYIILQDITKVN